MLMPHKNNDIELVEFFPVSRSTRMKETAKRNSLPFWIGIFCAAVVVVGMVIGTGGIHIPGAAMLAAMKGTFAPIIKKLIISVMAFIAFGLGFRLAKFLGLGKPKSLASFTDHMREDLNNHYQRSLPVRLKISNVRELYITHYCHHDDTVTLLLPSGIETEQPRRQIYIPLKDPYIVETRRRSWKVTHYCEGRNSFRLYDSASGEENEMPRQEVEKLRHQKPVSTHTNNMHLISRSRTPATDAITDSLWYDVRLSQPHR